MEFIKSLVPRPIKELIFRSLKPLALVKAYFRDARRFSRSSSVFSHRGRKENLRSLIVIDYHRIEKGLALPKPRKAFGIPVVTNLIILIENYYESFGSDWTVQDALASLGDYFYRFQYEGSLRDLQDRFDRLKSKIELSSEFEDQKAIGIFEKEEHLKKLEFNFSKFYQARHSVREFSGEKISEDDLRESICLAMRAPSVCNRQPWKVYGLNDEAKIRQLCQIQGGSKGFAPEINRLLAVCVDLSEFYLVGERNECYVDGGIFLQSLLICLHAKGFGACPLNWCVSTRVDDEARRLLPIDDSHEIIALVAVGCLKEVTKFARSERRPVEDVYLAVN